MTDEDLTVRREVPRLDPELVLPPPALLAPPIFEEPATAPPVPALLAAPVLEELTETSFRLPVIIDEPPAPSPGVKPARVPAGPVKRLPSPLTELVVLGSLGIAALAAFAGITWLAAIVVLLLVAAAGLGVLAYQPVLVFCLMGFTLGAAPNVQTPVLGVSITFVLSAAMWGALAVMPEVQHRVNWAAGLSAVLIGLAFFTFVGNPITGAAVQDFVRWSITAAAVYPLSVLPARQLARVGRWFVYGCTAAAAFGIALVAVDRDGSKLDRLTFLGYSADGGNGRFVFGANGNFARLTSTYVDPNLGGLIMAVGLLLALALLRGRLRVLSVGLLVLAIALTLSRADIGAVAVAAVLVVLFSGVSGRIRGRLLGLGVLAGTAMLALPAIRSRLTNSFGSNDRGSSARWEAFEIFPDQMSGHWLLGRGFGAPELVDASAAAATNYVANAPLLTVYRGGIVVGLAFTVLMLTAALFGWRLMRGSAFEPAAVGAGYLGIMLVALQLDFPVVTISAATLAFAILLVFVSRPDAFSDEFTDD
ncbi:hypothetical protein ABIE44_000823 [Marmoricola sp. OAE513]|uniref:hypothetical protein n=1 Tax=Marmoricola sp. OAE513 TaxID=2817894 RepID=UPI001AE90A5C